MTSGKTFTHIASGVFGVMAVLQAWLLISHVGVSFGSQMLPSWFHVAMFVAATFLSWMLFREARGTSGA
jgi:threonine/homoserine/homoserine lactone efflux protein